MAPRQHTHAAQSRALNEPPTPPYSHSPLHDIPPVPLEEDAVHFVRNHDTIHNHDFAKSHGFDDARLSMGWVQLRKQPPTKHCLRLPTSRGESRPLSRRQGWASTTVVCDRCHSRARADILMASVRSCPAERHRFDLPGGRRDECPRVLPCQGRREVQEGDGPEGGESYRAPSPANPSPAVQTIPALSCTMVNNTRASLFAGRPCQDREGVPPRERGATGAGGTEGFGGVRRA